MRVARFSQLLLLALAVSFPAGIAPPPVFASSQQDSIPPPRTHVATLHLDRGDSIRASYVGPWAYDAVRYEAVDGRVGYLALHQVARVVDSTGTDVTTRTLHGRKPLGSLSGERPQSFGGWLGGIAPPVTYRPNRHARAYTVVETSVLARDKGHDLTGSGTIYLVGLGGMRNLSRSWAVGGVVRVGGEVEDYGSADVGARVRRYLSDRWSLETTLGAFVAVGDRTETRGLPVFAEAAVTFADAVALVGRVERARWSESRFVWAGFEYYDTVRTERTETVWRGGIRIGSSPKWLSVPALLIGALVFLQPGADELYGVDRF
ncbi:MAG TPA: hypothetical protein VLT84_09460 [Acidobacteriota bacterium]|nr:hypothetical protein [Acidobacteriota bacterium]